MKSRRSMLQEIAALGALSHLTGCPSPDPLSPADTGTGEATPVDVAGLEAAVAAVFDGTRFADEFQDLAAQGEMLQQALAEDHPELAELVAHVSNAVCTPWLGLMSDGMSRDLQTEADVEALVGEVAGAVLEMVADLEAPVQAVIHAVEAGSVPGTSDTSSSTQLAESQRLERKMRRAVHAAGQQTHPLCNLLLQGAQATTARSQGEQDWDAVTEALQASFQDAWAMQLTWGESEPWKSCALSVAGAFGIGSGLATTLPSFATLLSGYLLSAEMALFFSAWLWVSFYAVVIALLVAMLLLLLLVAVVTYVDLILDCVEALEGKG